VRKLVFEGAWSNPMGQDNGKPPAQNPSTQDPQSAEQSIQDQSTAGAPPAEQNPHEASPSTTAQGELNADDLLHAAHVVPPADMVANVELTLDHLSATVDLFDIPPFDYGDTGGGDA
jgi:hypothetical protein